MKMPHIKYMWSYHLISHAATPYEFDNLNNLMKYCDIHRGQYMEYTISIPYIGYKRLESLPNLDDPGVRSGYYLDT